jgi:hypothetical protein
LGSSSLTSGESVEFRDIDKRPSADENAKLVSLVVVDESGNRIFASEDIPKISRLASRR